MISFICSTLLRSVSVSSIRRINLPLVDLAANQLKYAVRIKPICGFPVGDGAILVFIILFLLVCFFRRLLGPCGSVPFYGFVGESQDFFYFFFKRVKWCNISMLYVTFNYIGVRKMEKKIDSEATASEELLQEIERELRQADPTEEECDAVVVGCLGKIKDVGRGTSCDNRCGCDKTR